MLIGIQPPERQTTWPHLLSSSSQSSPFFTPFFRDHRVILPLWQPWRLRRKSTYPSPARAVFPSLETPIRMFKGMSETSEPCLQPSDPRPATLKSSWLFKTAGCSMLEHVSMMPSSLVSYSLGMSWMLLIERINSRTLHPREEIFHAIHGRQPSILCYV